MKGEKEKGSAGSDRKGSLSGRKGKGSRRKGGRVKKVFAGKD